MADLLALFAGGRRGPPARVPELLVLQGSPFCNIDCRYCYLPNRSSRERMPRAVLEAVARNILASPLCPDTVDVVWHAGEPLAVPAAALDEACTILAEGTPRGHRLAFHIQTNATLVDDRAIDVIRRHGIRIGVSLDGPRAIHDRNRVTRSGGGTFDRTAAGVERLRAAGIPFSIIAVLTRASLGEADALFDTFAALRPTSLGFNIEEVEGANRTSSLEGYDVPALYRAFLDRFLARWREAGEPFALRAVDTVLGAGARGHGGHDHGRPLSIVSVAVDGGLSTYSPELLGVTEPAYNDFVFGNVLDGGLDQILSHPAFGTASRAIDAGRRRCRRACGYFAFCGGGAPANKFFEHGTFDAGETLYCRLVVKETVEAVLGVHEAARRA